MKRMFPTLPVALTAAALITAGCDSPDPVTPLQTIAAAHVDVPAPAPLVTVASGATELELWPYTTVTLGGPPSDPMNVLFPDADVRWVRAALMMLDGDRTAFGFPSQAPFDCTWKEAMGANQAGYSTPSAWTASAIQLECGDYGPIRFHIRMFPAGDWTIANAHFEVLISGTNQHEVLSWELAEQLVTVDLIRAGAAVGASGIITETPSFRAINPLVYNGLPAPLIGLIGGPAPPQTDPVPLVNDGSAAILTLSGEVRGQRTVARREFVLQFDQTIPKPFCADGPLDYLYVRGPIQFTQQVVVSPNGGFMSWFHAGGNLTVTPVNPLTGQPTGDDLSARVAEHDRSVVTDEVTLVSTFQLQILLPKRNPDSGSLRATLRVGPGGVEHATVDVDCTT